MATKLRKVHVEEVFSFRLDVYCDDLGKSERKLAQLEGVVDVYRSYGFLIVRPDPRYDRHELIEDIKNILS